MNCVPSNFSVPLKAPTQEMDNGPCSNDGFVYWKIQRSDVGSLIDVFINCITNECSLMKMQQSEKSSNNNSMQLNSETGLGLSDT